MEQSNTSITRRPRVVLASLGLLITGCTATAPPPLAGAAGSTSEVANAAAPKAVGPRALDQPPAGVLDLSQWMLSLPIGEPLQPTEVVQPALAGYIQEGVFYASAKGVVFRAPAGGVTAPTENYPSAELSETGAGGTQRAAWSTTQGRHSMTLGAAITHTPISKPDVVAGRLHDARGEVVAIRLERSHLFVAAGGNNLGTLEANYTLGTEFSVVIDASEGRVRVYYNGEQTPRVDVERKVEGCYFKAGAHTLSNPTKGDQNEAYSEVIISQLSVVHVN